MTVRPAIAIAHDYLTQQGGAERVVLAMAGLFPDAVIHTSLYDPAGTFPEFARCRIATTRLDRSGLLRTHHRLALPLLAGAFDRMQIDADVVVCSSSGWAHGASTTGRKIVYCHTPARWLYQDGRYLGAGAGPNPRRLAGRVALGALRGRLVAWDRRAASSADLYLANSTAVWDRVRDLYAIEAQVVPAPHTAAPDQPAEPVPGITDGTFACVARLLPYKNVDAVVEAFRSLPDERLVVVGSGPLEARLRRDAPSNVTVAGRVTDGQLRWVYQRSAAVIAASYEDYGLTPLEAAAFGKPAVVLRWGGFVDTTVEGHTGVFFDQPTPDAIGDAVRSALATSWDPEALRAHAARYSVSEFGARLRGIIDAG